MNDKCITCLASTSAVTYCACAVVTGEGRVTEACRSVQTRITGAVVYNKGLAEVARQQTRLEIDLFPDVVR